ncbi:MAG: metalloregulator ArsR/SmtB family transcription factor [Cyclobacteriaceae bacterium]|nr:metalloregulator ArsR/SmtB family transcription factor [Cyclobacteriaceae bacterium]
MRLKKFNIPVGAQIFKACSEEPRIRVLNLILQKKKVSISDVESITDYTQSKVSRHITYLKNAGMLNAEQHQNWVLYSLKEEVLDIVQQIFIFLEKDPVLRADIEIYNTLFSNRELSVNKIPKQGYNN